MNKTSPHYAETEISKVFASPLNARREVGDIDELIESIREKGILEPLLGRPAKNRIEIIAGTRRLAAAQCLGLKLVPVVVREMTDEEALVISVTENLQRGDLALNDRVQAYDRLRTINPEKFASVEAIAQALGIRPRRITEDYAAYNAMRRLKSGGVQVATTRSQAAGAQPHRETVPYGHAVSLDQTMDSIRAKLPKDQVRQKYLEVAREIAPLPRDEAERFLSYVKMYPEKPTREIRTLAFARVERPVSLPADTARLLEEKARALGKEKWEDAIETLLDAPPTPAPTTTLPPDQPAIKPTSRRSSDSTSEVEETLWLNKLQWNLNAGLKCSADLYTIGLEGRTLACLIQALKRFGIKTVVDVRETHADSAPEFEKANLGRALKENGITYTHRPELGIPKGQVTAAVDRRSQDAIWEQYRKETIPVLDRLLRSKLSLSKGEVAFLCEERDPTACHRHCIAEHLTARGFKAYDI